MTIFGWQQHVRVDVTNKHDQKNYKLSISTLQTQRGVPIQITGRSQFTFTIINSSENAVVSIAEQPNVYNYCTRVIISTRFLERVVVRIRLRELSGALCVGFQCTNTNEYYPISYGHQVFYM